MHIMYKWRQPLVILKNHRDKPSDEAFIATALGLKVLYVLLSAPQASGYQNTGDKLWLLHLGFQLKFSRL